MAKKCVLILLDGLGDRAFKDLNYQTPLQAAHTPTLDKLATMGSNGLYHAAALGQALPSENAHFSMFGYDMVDFPGRGALEALGSGIDLKPKDVAILTHIASLHEINGCLFLDQNKPAASQEEAEAIIDDIKEYEINDIKIRFIQTEGIFGIITLSGNVSPYITDTNPMLDGHPLSEITPWDNFMEDTACLNTAKALKSYLVWIYHRLQNHTVNISRRERGMPQLSGLVTQRSGRLKKVISFTEKYGLNGLSISSGIVYQGLSKFLGIDTIKADDTDNPSADISERLEIACNRLEFYDFIHVHTKVPDEAAHKKDPLGKKIAIEALDRGIGNSINHLLKDPEFLLIITADHSTPSSGPLIHSGEPVPLTICGENVRRDGVKFFDEINAASGALSCVRGKELMYLILNYLDRAKLQGIMDMPVDQPFWPGNYESFRIDFHK